MDDFQVKQILVTGAFSLVGEEAVSTLLHSGYAVICLDLDSPEKHIVENRLKTIGDIKTIWLDGSDLAQASAAIETLTPQVVVHLLAVSPPDCYQNQKFAKKINVDFSKLLLAESKKNMNLERFIFVSTTTIHGPRNPHQEVNAIRSESPLDPRDNFSKQKAIVEALVRDSGLPWSILRLPTVFGLRPQPSGDAFMKYLYTLPPQRRQHGIDARDVGLAISNAVKADILFRILPLGGKTPDWMRTAGEIFAAISVARGFKPIPDRYYRNPDPTVDDAWYYEDWVNTAESQLFLDYQKHSFAEYINDLAKLEKPVPNWLMNLMSPLVLRQLIKHSSYDREKDALDERSHWEVIKELFQISHED